MAKEAVLQQLQQAADCLSGEEMAQSLGISRAAVLARLGAHPWAGQVQVLATVDSTNSAL